MNDLPGSGMLQQMSTFLNPAFLISMLIALAVHEWAHAFVAHRLGDPTAEQEGRLTVNPVAHLDPIGTVLFLLIGFGWGKPVPVDPRYFRSPKRDLALVSIAGPFSNLVLAFLAFGALMLFAPEAMTTSPWALLESGSFNALGAVGVQICKASIFLNLGLMAFNLLPVAPLDGSKIAAMFVPLRYEYQYHVWMERGPYILMGLLLVEHLLNIPILFGWIFGIMSPFLAVMDAVAGMVG